MSASANGLTRAREGAIARELEAALGRELEAAIGRLEQDLAAALAFAADDERTAARFQVLAQSPIGQRPLAYVQARAALLRRLVARFKPEGPTPQ